MPCPGSTREPTSSAPPPSRTGSWPEGRSSTSSALRCSFTSSPLGSTYE